jgi:short-subunit dehydrogenase
MGEAKRDSSTGGGVAGKRVLVTGASSGIGAALARELAAAGAVVGVCARRRDQLERVLADCRTSSPESRMWAVDLADLGAIADFAARADDELGGIDVLVNNAGVPKRRHVLSLRPDEVETVMTINFFSPVRLTLALLAPMIERGAGRIVNVSSVAAKLGPPGESAYAASKAALSAWSESLAVDLGDEPVDVQVVYPGVIDTPLFQLPDNDPFDSDIEALPAEDMARAIVELIEGDDLELYFPQYFAELVSGRAADVAAFVAGTREYLRSRKTAPA